MKNKILITTVITLGLICSIVTTNNVIAAQTTTGSSSGKATKAQLDKLAMSILKAAEKRDNAGMQPYFKEMMLKGVTSVTSPQVVAKRTPQCPPVKMELNGKKLSGKLCARMSYEYEGKIYWVGYCK